MDFSLVYMTAKDRQQAEEIGEILVAEKLAACVNILDKMRSIYRWQGEIVRDEETVLVAKTRSELVADIIASVKQHHSYSVPCVLELPINSGNPEYLDWIADETRK